jgi:DNA-directed RNA polymerase subunit alpha
MEIFSQDKSIDTLDLSVRARNALLRSGYKKIEDLLFLKPEEILSIRNVGKRTLDEILSMQHKLLYDSDFTQEATKAERVGGGPSSEDVCISKE